MEVFLLNFYLFSLLSYFVDFFFCRVLLLGRRMNDVYVLNYERCVFFVNYNAVNF